MMFPNPDIIESAVLGSNLNSCKKYSKPNRFGPHLMCSDRFEPYSMSFDLAEYSYHSGLELTSNGAFFKAQ